MCTAQPMSLNLTVIELTTRILNGDISLERPIDGCNAKIPYINKKLGIYSCPYIMNMQIATDFHSEKFES